MKTHPLPTLLTLGALLPLAAWAETPADTDHRLQREAYDPRPSETRSGPGSRIPDNKEERYSDQTGKSMSDRSTQSSDELDPAVGRPSTGLSATPGQIQRVSDEQLKQRVTASSLMGKKVVDREGQEIGKVKDVGLTAIAPQLGTSTSAGASGMSSRAQPTTGGEAQVFVQTSRALDLNGDIVAIPASQFMREGDTLRVDLSREQLRSAANQSRETEPVSTIR